MYFSATATYSKRAKWLVQGICFIYPKHCMKPNIIKSLLAWGGIKAQPDIQTSATIEFSKYHRLPLECGLSLFSNMGKLYPRVPPPPPPLIRLGRTLEFHCWFNRNETGWIWGYFINLPALSLQRKLRQIEFKTPPPLPSLLRLGLPVTSRSLSLSGKLRPN